MRYTRFLLTLLLLGALFASLPAVFAQGDSDGDGLPDDVDNCPNQPGPRDNRGCPVDSDGDGVADTNDNCPDQPGDVDNAGCPTPTEVPLNERDSDNDGLTDDIDYCPSVAGPQANGGCPLLEEVVDDQPAVDLQPLPALPITGPCVMATNGHVPVNLRSLPFETAPVTGSMDPQQFYPVHYFFDNPQDQRWNQTTGGLAASWVTRLGGICRGMTVLSFAEDDDPGTTIKLAAEILLPTDLFGFNPQPEPPALTFPIADFPFPDPPGDPTQMPLMASFGPDVPPDPILVGLLLPAIQKAVDDGTETAADHEEEIDIHDIQWYGVMETSGNEGAGDEHEAEFDIAMGAFMFNPQPEPPPEQLTGPLFTIMLEILPQVGEPTEAEGEDDIELMPVPVELTARNMGEIDPALCDSSMLPTAEQACIYTNDAGQVAVCTLLGDTTYCMYGFPPEPVME